MGNPRDRTLHRRRFAASYAAANKESVGATTSGYQGRKRVRFAQGTDCSLESESDAKAKSSDAEAPKTSEYAFFRKLRQDAGKTGFPVRKENNADKCEFGDGSGNAEVGNICSQSFQKLKFPLRAQDDTHAEASSLLSPIAGPSKATDKNSFEGLDFRNPEFSHPTKKPTFVTFEISCSPFRDRQRSTVASYVYGQGNICSFKRDKLLQHVANTYPQSKDLKLTGVDLVNSMLDRLFPNGYNSQHLYRAHKLKQQDTCATLSPGYPGNSADCQEYCWSGRHGSREERDFMLLDYGCTSSGSTELAKWSGDYGMSLDRSGDNECIHHKMERPYHISDYVRSRSPWKKYLPSRLPCETFVSHRSRNIVSQHSADLPSRQNLLLGWVDEKTEDEDRLQIAPHKFDYDISSHADRQTLWKNEYQLGANFNSSLSRIQPQFVSGRYGNMDSYLKTTAETDIYVESDHFLEDRENKSWDIIHSHSLGSCFTEKDGDSDLPCMNSHIFRGTPYTFGAQELISVDYPRGQIMCIDQPWEVCGKEVPCSNYQRHDYRRNTDGGCQIGYCDEPSYDQTTYHIFPLTLDGGNRPGRCRSLYGSP